MIFSDGVLDQNEFETFLKSVFSFNGNSYYIPKERLRKFFQYYDKNKVFYVCLKFNQFYFFNTNLIFFLKINFKNNKIELDEFENFWNNTLKKVSHVFL